MNRSPIAVIASGTSLNLELKALSLSPIKTTRRTMSGRTLSMAWSNATDWFFMASWKIAADLIISMRLTSENSFSTLNCNTLTSCKEELLWNRSRPARDSRILDAVYRLVSFKNAYLAKNCHTVSFAFGETSLMRRPISSSPLGSWAKEIFDPLSDHDCSSNVMISGAIILVHACIRIWLPRESEKAASAPMEISSDIIALRFGLCSATISGEFLFSETLVINDGDSASI